MIGCDLHVSGLTDDSGSSLGSDSATHLISAESQPFIRNVIHRPGLGESFSARRRGRAFNEMVFTHSA